MSSLRTTLIWLTILILPLSGEESLTFSRLKNPPDSLTETFYKIPTNGTIDIKGDIIQRINIHTETGKSHAGMAVFSKNTTPEAVSPQYVIRFYNAYGIMMGGVQVSADEKTPDSKISPGAESIKTHHPRITRLETLFRHTNLTTYPTDFFSISWLSISNSNDKKIEQAADNQAAAETNTEKTDTSQTEPK